MHLKTTALNITTASLVSLVSFTGANAQDFNMRYGQLGCSESFEEENPYLPTAKFYGEVDNNTFGDTTGTLGFELEWTLGAEKYRQRRAATRSTRCDDAYDLGLSALRLDMSRDRLELEQLKLRLDRQKRSDLLMAEDW